MGDEQYIPVVTVLIANHNYGQYLDRAIQSALDQDYPKVNLCIVDDCSTDKSWEIIHKRLFKQIAHQNQVVNGIKVKSGKMLRDNGMESSLLAIQLPACSGPSIARNVGIEQTWYFTDIYAILDADDEYYKTKVLRCVNKILKSPTDIGVVYTDYDILNTETGNVIREYKEPFDVNRLHQECIVHSGAIITKQALEKSRDSWGYYDSTMRTCEDYDLWLRISESFIIVHIPEALSLVRVTPHNSTNTVAKEIWNQNWQRVQQKVEARCRSQQIGS